MLLVILVPAVFKDAWIGLERENGIFIWANGVQLNYSNWNSSEPEDGQQCVYLGQGSYWKTTNCQDSDFEAHYICQIPGKLNVLRLKKNNNGCRKNVS